MNKDGRHYCDVLVIGSGIAGLSAAITASEQGLDVIVVTKNSIEESNTFYAQGGIVSRGIDDSPDILIEDIMQAGDGISNIEAVKACCRRRTAPGGRFSHQESRCAFYPFSGK